MPKSVTTCQQGINLEDQNVDNFAHNMVAISRHGTHSGTTVFVCFSFDFGSIPSSGTVSCGFPAGTDERVSLLVAVDSPLPAVAFDFAVPSDDVESCSDCAEVDPFTTYVKCRSSHTLIENRITENVPTHEHRIVKHAYIASVRSHPPRLGPRKQIAGRTKEKIESGTAAKSAE